MYESLFKLGLYNKCWGDTTTVSLPTLFFWAYRTKSVCENPYNTRYLLVL